MDHKILINCAVYLTLQRKHQSIIYFRRCAFVLEFISMKKNYSKTKYNIPKQGHTIIISYTKRIFLQSCSAYRVGIIYCAFLKRFTFENLLCLCSEDKICPRRVFSTSLGRTSFRENIN